MAWHCGSFSRSLLSTARASTSRSSPSSLPRLRPPLSSSLNAPSRRLLSSSAALPRSTGVLGCIQSLLPLHSAVAASVRTASHITVEARACCELSQGT